MTAADVLALQVGETVTMRGRDAAGREQRVVCTVARRGGGAKFLTYRVKGALKRCAIRDYEGRYYEKGGV